MSTFFLQLLQMQCEFLDASLLSLFFIIHTFNSLVEEFNGQIQIKSHSESTPFRVAIEFQLFRFLFGRV